MKWGLGLCAAFVFGLWLRGHYHLMAAQVLAPLDEALVAQGERIFLREGCYGCHTVSEWPALPAPGPALDFVRSKLSRELVYTWLTRPRAYRPELRVSSHFLRDDSEVSARALTAFLLQRSRVWSTPKPQAHNEALGQALYDTLACAACHGSIEEGFPNIGEKTTASWLSAFLRKPASYDPQTTMPDFRLSQSDADALAAVLSVQNDGLFEVRFPHLTRAAVEGVDDALSAEGVAEVNGVPLERALFADKEVALGERRYAQAGCGACHQLVTVARSDAAVATARDSMPAVLEGALATLTRPGSHPQFALSPDEQHAVAAFLHRPWRAKLSAAEAGDLHMRTLGCAACHEPQGTAKRRAPSLSNEGHRAKPEWLFSYLAKPTTSAKNSTAKDTAAKDKKATMVMPTFALTDSALNDIVTALNPPRVTFESAPAAHGSLSECKSCHDAAAFTQMRAHLRPSWVQGYLLTHPSEHDATTAEGLAGAVFATEATP